MAGIGDGLAMGAQMALDYKRDKAERALRQKLLEDQIKAERERQQAELTEAARRQQEQNGFTSGESEKDRTFRTGERRGGEGFQATQAELDRAARQLALDRELEQRKWKDGADVTLAARRLEGELPETAARTRLLDIQSDVTGTKSDPTRYATVRRNIDPDDPLSTATYSVPVDSLGAIGGTGGAGGTGFEAFEGRVVTGPDGKRYKIVNGKPVLVQ